MKDKIAIIEIGSTNTKINIYNYNILEITENCTIEFKNNYYKNNKIEQEDLNKLYEVIEKAMKITNNVKLYGCSIFRNITSFELAAINKEIFKKYNTVIEVITQEDEARFTALGCYGNIEYKKDLCIFIGGGGSTELIFIKDKKIIKEMHFDFGVVDITRKFNTLKNDIPECTFEEVSNYINELIGDIDFNSDVLILAGGDHLYWYNNAKYDLLNNKLYSSEEQRFMLTKEMSDNYDRDALVTSLDKIRCNSDNPLWFDGSRAMKVITNVISNKINAKYIVPTKINMEQGLINNLMK